MALSSNDPSDAHSQSEYSVHGGEDSSEYKFEQHLSHDVQLSPSAQREVSGSLGRQLWIKQKEVALGKLQHALSSEGQSGIFSILPLDLSNFLQRFGNTPLADEYYAALIDYLHASTDYRFVPQPPSERNKRAKKREERSNISRAFSGFSKMSTDSFASNFTGGTAQAASTSDERLSSKQIGRLGDKRGTAHAGRTRLSRTSSGASAESASRVAKNRTDENRVGGVDEQGATAEVFGDEPGIEFPPSLSESAEGLVVAGIYRIIVFRYSNPPMPSRERAFFELLHQLAMEATTSTFPLALRPAIAREMARICRSDFFNSTRRVDEEREDSEVSRVRAKDLYALRNLGRSGGKDSRIINAMNVKRKSLHPHISVTRQEALEARSRMVAAVVPAPMERLKHSLDLIKAEATLSRSCLDVHTDGGGGGGGGERRHAMTRPPFDVSTKGQGSAGGLGLRAASAAAGGGHTTWTCHQTLSPDRTRIHRLVESNGRRFLQQMYTREIRRATYSGDHKHWARSLTAKQAVGGQDAADASTGASDLQQQPDASQAQPDPVAPRVPHYLVGSETEILRQAIDDHRTALMVADNDKQKHLIASLHAAHAAAKLLRKTERAKKRAREENLKKKMSTMQEREAAMRATLSDSNRL